MTKKQSIKEAASEAETPDIALTNYTAWIARGLTHPKMKPAIKDALQSIIVNVITNQSGYVWDDDVEGLRFMLPRLLFHMNDDYAQGALHALGELIDAGLPEQARREIGSPFGE
jgi:hypothetical protein